MFLHFGDVFVQIAPAEDAAVDFRVQRFHAAVEHFGETGVVGHFDNGDARIGQKRGGAAGGEDFYARFVQSAGKFDCAVFVGQTNQGALDFCGGHGFPLGWGWIKSG